MRLGWRVPVLVGLIPWLAAFLVYGGLLVATAGAEGFRIALRDTFAVPVIMAPALTCLAFLWLRRALGSRASEAHLRAWLTGSCMCILALLNLIVLGILIGGSTAAISFAAWGVMSGYVILVGVLSGLSSFKSPPTGDES